ncbi:hypothetical protein N7493_005163 [Penicillium malachiteum]|uniref:Uncharacterized protein n=1 Tax=Penicillium malachiteum TaxID=1324776 RepID=A0AAD6HME6_9EURO|nr:hypothetical protein N7493_005163 [Penicillium malachiteum]
MPPDENNEKPLTASRPEQYSCKDAELRIAAYIGMSSISDFRQLLFSWPLLKATMKLHTLWKRLQRAKILEVLRWHIPCFEYTDVNEIEETSEPDENEISEHIMARRHRKTAWYLIN